MFVVLCLPCTVGCCSRLFVWLETQSHTSNRSLSRVSPLHLHRSSQLKQIIVSTNNCIISCVDAYLEKFSPLFVFLIAFRGLENILSHRRANSFITLFRGKIFGSIHGQNFQTECNAPSTKDVRRVMEEAFLLPGGRVSPIFSSFSRSARPPFLDFALKQTASCGSASFPIKPNENYDDDGLSHDGDDDHW